MFGAEDERLKTPRRNTQNLSGSSYISYRLDWSGTPGKLIITRVGYAADDSPDNPLATVDIPGADPTSPHTLTVEVLGNLAKTYLDGKLIDSEKILKNCWFMLGIMIMSECLIPRYGCLTK